MITLNQSQLDTFQVSVDALYDAVKKHKSNPQKECDQIAKNLKDAYHYKFTVKVVKPKHPKDQTFIMSVYPEIDTLTAIMKNILASEGDPDAVKTKTYNAWRKNNIWHIEIDRRIFNSVSNRELAALLLHEVGHVIYSDTVIDKITTTLRFREATAPAHIKALMNDSIFASFFGLPILDACSGDRRLIRKNLEREIRADKFAKMYGYDKELYDVFNRIIASGKTKGNLSTDKKIIVVADYTHSTMDDMYKRRDAVAKKHLLSLKKECTSPYIEEFLDKEINKFFESEDPSVFTNTYDIIHERMDEDVENYYEEHFLFGKKKVKKVDLSDLDYIQVTINKIENENDRLMVISYIHSKLDRVNYYISILENPDLAKKYDIPQSLSQLELVRKQLLILRKKALEYKIPGERNVLVSWPVGYEG